MGKEHMRQPLRILQVVDKLTPDSGVAGVVMRYHDAIDKKQIVFDFLVHEEPDLRIRRRLEKDGSKIFVAPPLRLAALVPYLRFLRRFYGEHPEYAIVHGHLPNAAPFYLGMARAIGVPVRIVHCHNTRSGDTAPKRIRNSLLFKLIPLCANVRCACSEAAAKFLYGGRGGRVKRPYHLVRNALPLEPYRFRPDVRERTRGELGLGADRLVVGHIGRMCPQKNQAFLLKIFAAFYTKHKNAVLMLIGDGELHEALRRQARELVPEEAVLWLGVRTDVPALLQAMDVFVLPSLYEGLPLAALEAQASGLPCLLSANITEEARIVPALAQYISLQKTPAEWAALIQPRRERASDTGRFFAAAGYDIFTEAAKLATLYEKLHEEHCRQRPAEEPLR